MFIERRNSNMFTYPDRFIPVIPVNCVATPGAGVALQMRRRFPRLTALYLRWCRSGFTSPEGFTKAEPGAVVHLVDAGRTYCLAATKDHWRNPSRQSDIIAILDHLYNQTEERRYVMPAIGCGLGGLDYHWLREQVRLRFGGHTSVHVALIAPPGVDPECAPATSVAASPHASTAP